MQNCGKRRTAGKGNAQAFAFVLLCVFFLPLFSVGCQTYTKRVFRAREAFYCNQLDAAVSTVQELREKPANAQNRDVLKLEEAMMRMCRGEFRESERLLREVRDSFDELENRKLKKGAEAAASMLADDKVLSYPGEDYEKVMVRVMLAINSLMKDGADARAYAHQINQKQEEIIAQSPEDPETKEKIKKSYRNLGIGPFISGILLDSDVTARQEQIRDFTKVTQWSPDFIGGHELLERAQNGIHSEKGNGVVYVFAMVGHGPFKVEKNAETTQAAMLCADILISATSKHTVTPTIASVPIPEVLTSPVRYRSAKITVDGADPVLTEKITDVNRMALDQFEANKPWIMARAIARRAVKKAGLYGLKEVSGVSSPEGELLIDLAGILWEASEEADTRCWNLLPGSIQVARLELPAGEHDLTLAASETAANRSLDELRNITRYDARGVRVSLSTPLSPPSGPVPHHGPIPHHGAVGHSVNISFQEHPPHPHGPAPHLRPHPQGDGAFPRDHGHHVHKVWKNLLQEKTENPNSCNLHLSVEDGRNTYIFVYFGDYGLIGRPYVNTP